MFRPFSVIFGHVQLLKLKSKCCIATLPYHVRRRFEAICVKYSFEVSFQHISLHSIYLRGKTWYRRVVWHCMIVYFVTIELNLPEVDREGTKHISFYVLIKT